MLKKWIQVLKRQNGSRQANAIALISKQKKEIKYVLYHLMSIDAIFRENQSVWESQRLNLVHMQWFRCVTYLQWYVGHNIIACVSESIMQAHNVSNSCCSTAQFDSICVCSKFDALARDSFTKRESIGCVFHGQFVNVLFLINYSSMSPPSFTRHFRFCHLRIELFDGHGNFPLCKQFETICLFT